VKEATKYKEKGCKRPGERTRQEESKSGFVEVWAPCRKWTTLEKGRGEGKDTAQGKHGLTKMRTKESKKRHRAEVGKLGRRDRQGPKMIKKKKQGAGPWKSRGRESQETKGRQVRSPNLGSKHVWVEKERRYLKKKQKKGRKKMYL